MAQMTKIDCFSKNAPNHPDIASENMGGQNPPLGAHFGPVGWPNLLQPLIPAPHNGPISRAPGRINVLFINGSRYRGIGGGGGIFVFSTVLGSKITSRAVIFWIFSPGA